MKRVYKLTFTLSPACCRLTIGAPARSTPPAGSEPDQAEANDVEAWDGKTIELIQT